MQTYLGWSRQLFLTCYVGYISLSKCHFSLTITCVSLKQSTIFKAYTTSLWERGISTYQSLYTLCNYQDQSICSSIYLLAGLCKWVKLILTYCTWKLLHRWSKQHSLMFWWHFDIPWSKTKGCNLLEKG